MASAEERALVKLSEELSRVERQIRELLEQQTRLHRKKVRLEATRDSSYAAVSTLHSPGRRTPAVVVATPAPRAIWERQRGRGSGRMGSPPPPQPIFTSTNRFEVLSSLSPSPARQTVASSSPRSSSGPASRNTNKGSVVIIGDSIVRHLKIADPSVHSSVSCLPGARVLDVARRLPVVLRKHAGPRPRAVVIHVGTNDTSARRSEILKEHVCSLLDTARKKTDARIIVSGPLPTYRRGSERFSRLFALHSWLRDFCGGKDVDYVDNWESFRGRPVLYRPDGLHPSPLGSCVLSENIRRVLLQD